MTASDSTLASMRQVSWSHHAAREALVLALCYVTIAPLIYWLQGAHGLAVSAIAGGVCLFSALGASAAANFSMPESMPYVPAMIAMLIRLFLPLVFCVVVAVGSDETLARDIAVYLILFYMVALALETGFALSRVRAAALPQEQRNSVQPTSRGL